MPRLPRKPLAYLISATAVGVGLGLAITPVALANDENQPPTPDKDKGKGSSQCGDFITQGPQSAGKIAACPLVDPKFSFSPPTEKAAPPAATGKKDSDEDSREARHKRHELRNARNRAAAEDD